MISSVEVFSLSLVTLILNWNTDKMDPLIMLTTPYEYESNLFHLFLEYKVHPYLNRFWNGFFFLFFYTQYMHFLEAK